MDGLKITPLSSPLPGAAAPETRDAMAALRTAMQDAGWTFPPESVASLRALVSAEATYSDRAEEIKVPGRASQHSVRVLRSPDPTGVYLYCHPGGWTLGSADGQDPALEQIVDVTGMTVLSIEYRLAPENPYPAGLDDCEDVARWVLENAPTEFGADEVIIAGGSAGANLAVCTALRIRDSEYWKRCVGVSLVYGNFDLTMAPSQIGASAEDYLISTESLEFFYDQYVPDIEKRKDPDISPVYADLSDLPHTFVSVGSGDSLLDDSLLLAGHLVADGVECTLQIVPGADHGFNMLDIPVAQAATSEMLEDLRSCLSKQPGAAEPA